MDDLDIFLDNLFKNRDTESLERFKTFCDEAIKWQDNLAAQFGLAEMVNEKLAEMNT